MGMKRAWYLRLDESQTPTAAILVGDRSRVRLLQDLMSDVRVLNEDRGLLTVVGNYKGTQIIVVAFGMGAPIAAVVAHELVDLGVALADGDGPGGVAAVKAVEGFLQHLLDLGPALDGHRVDPWPPEPGFDAVAIEIGLPGREIVQGLRATLVLHIAPVNARAKREQRGGQMRRTAIAAGPVVQRARLRLCQRNQFTDRIRRHR